MSEDTKDVVIQDPNLEAEVVVTEPSNLDELGYDELKEVAATALKNAQTLNAQRKHFKEKYEKAKETPKEQPTPPITNNPDTLTREEAVLIAQGLGEEDLIILKQLSEGAKAIGKPITLSEAKNNPLYIAYQEKKEADEKAKKKSLGPSGGNPSGNKNVVDTSKMTREEHEAYARKKISG